MKRTTLVLGAYALLAILVVPVFPHFISPNEITRWMLAASLVENGEVEITRYAGIFGPRLEDLSIKDGRVYSNKAPGTTLAGLPGYGLLRLGAGKPSPANLRAMLTAMRLYAATLPLLLLGLLFAKLGRAHEAGDDWSAIVVWVLLFATPLFAYGLLLFSHALVAAALFGAWAFLFVMRRHDWIAGALLGLAVASEYPAIIPTLIFMIALLVTKEWSRTARVIGGAAPFAILLMLYHQLAFGGPFTLPYGNDALPEFRQLSQSGIFGVTFPSPVTLARILFDPTRGLFVFAPVLLLAIPAFIIAKKRLPAAAWWTLLLVPVAIILFYAGYPNWHGGWNVGPRYVVPAIPFLVAPLLFAPRLRRPAVILGGCSFVAVFLTTIVFPFPPNAFPFPWMTLAAPLLGEGLIAPNLLHWIARPLAIAVPFAVAIAAMIGVLRKEALLATIGVLIAIVIGAQGERLAAPELLALQRNYIAEVYFERDGALGSRVPSGLIRRRELEMQLPPGSWPF